MWCGAVVLQKCQFYTFQSLDTGNQVSEMPVESLGGLLSLHLHNISVHLKKQDQPAHQSIFFVPISYILLSLDPTVFL